MAVTKFVTEAKFKRVMDDMLEALGKSTGEFVGKQVAPLKAALNERMRWCGTWRSGVKYSEHDVCQDKGALFICKAPTSDARPGVGPGWQQMHKTTKP
jgi:hypothetical protein